MELLQGEELGDILERAGAVPPVQAVSYLRQVASALDKTHAAGIVHRDLKPENLFLTHREDGTARIKILDFGISKVVSEAHTGANATRSLGTPMYMAPEQVLGQPVSPATDLYSLGLIAYTLLVGDSYWQRDTERYDNPIAFALHTTKGALESAVERASLLGRDLPAAFDAWFRRATHLDPTQRFRRASEMVNELSALLGCAEYARAGTPIPGVPSSFASPSGASPISSGSLAQRTGFGSAGTIPGATWKSRKAPWFIAASVLGMAALAAVLVWHERGTTVTTSTRVAWSSARAPQAAVEIVPLADSAVAPTVPVVTVAASASSAALAPRPASSTSQASPLLNASPRVKPPLTSAPARPATTPQYTRD
jgi:serine/threonine-protein kinase